MDKEEVGKSMGKYIITPRGRQLLAGYQVMVIRQNGALLVYPNSVVLLCWSPDGGLYHHDMIDCKIILDKQ